MRDKYRYEDRDHINYNRKIHYENLKRNGIDLRTIEKELFDYINFQIRNNRRTNTEKIDCIKRYQNFQSVIITKESVNCVKLGENNEKHKITR